MAKKSLKTIAILALFAIPQPINESYSPRLKKLENINAFEISEKEKTKLRYNLIELNEDIKAIQRKKDFLSMRLNEKDISDSLKNNYTKKLNETNKELKKYYSKKDSIYNLLKK